MVDRQIHDRDITDPEVANLLKKSKTIAVVGISHKEDRDSNKVARYLVAKGYTVIPVNPKYKEVMGLTCYPDLPSVPHHIDIVDIFRNVEAMPAIVDEAIQVKADCVWMQLGLAHNEAAEKARSQGIQVVMNKCIKIEHSRMTA